MAKYDPTPEVISVVISAIKVATPRNTFRGREDRNRIVKATIKALKEITYSKSKG